MYTDRHTVRQTPRHTPRHTDRHTDGDEYSIVAVDKPTITSKIKHGGPENKNRETWEPENVNSDQTVTLVSQQDSTLYNTI